MLSKNLWQKNKLRLNIISYRKSRFCIFLYVDEYAAYIGIPIIMILDLICIALLAKEANHCDETLRREILLHILISSVKETIAA